MKKTLLFIGALMCGTFLFSQYTPFEDVSFSDETIEIPEEFNDSDEIILFQNRKVEIVSGSEGVEEYVMVHEKTLVNSDDAIEKNNRLYISFRSNERIVLNKNRVILPDGTVIELNDDDIHEETDTETGRSYAYYAVKGIEKGAMIEKLYVKQVAPNLTDNSFAFQFSAPIIQSQFELIHPDFLGFKTKSYNGLMEPHVDENRYEDKISIYVSDSLIFPINTEEKLANISKHRKYFRYKLHENYSKGTKNFYNYNNFAKNAYSNLVFELPKKDVKAIDKFTKDLNITDNMYLNVLEIEHLVKTTIINDYYYDKNNSLADLIKAKKGTVLDVLVLYKSIFDKFDIPAEFVFTTDRFDMYFDPEFETTNNLTYGLLYFKELDMFLDPRNKSYRIPLINSGHAHNHGLRLKEKEYSGTILPVADLMFIEAPSMQLTTDTMNITIDFTSDIANPKVTSHMNFGGYSGAHLQGIVDQVPEDRYEEILEDILKNYSADAEMDKKEVLNNGVANMGKKNLILNLEFQGKDLTQKAGDKYLFKLGETIGKQQEIYQSEKRMMPVEIDYPHYYYRTLTVILPDGYKVSNPETATFDFKTIMDDKEEAVFTSSYTVENNTYSIENIEYYNTVLFPLEKFESYQNVLNAAADFNKIVWVIEKSE